MNVALRAEIADKIAKCEQLSLRNEDLDAKLEQAELDRIQTVANSDGATVQLDGGKTLSIIPCTSLVTLHMLCK